MSYIVSADLNRTIQDVNLQQIISADTSILDLAIFAAEAEAKSYLRQKYDITLEFRDTPTFDDAATYQAADRVVFNNSIYSAIYPYPPFEYTGVYNRGNQVFWKNKTYTCLIATPVLDHDTALQYRTYRNLPYLNVAPDDIQNGVTYWGEGSIYTILPAMDPTDTTIWAKADNRDAQMVMFICDVALFHLHSRIAPRNIPEIRIKRYESAVEWFKMCATGEVTPELPLLQPLQGNRIRFGGNIKQINSY